MPEASALLGTWQMVSWRKKVLATGEVADAMGSDPIGYIAYHADGRMMALVLKRDRPPLMGLAPTDEEKIRLFDTMLAYSATYTLEGDKVVHHVDAAWNPAWAGADLNRPFKLDGDNLIISGAPSKDPATGEDVIYRIEFIKVR
ncbi:lipocalin-like domain-containing protein [Microvirga sp. ACRRW]|uniref:lipocalin-like domain-containing protein n=1 Tax=Microvirga sp. ACRRW TaxID=2918205 RepID=UPI001EF5A8BB|nr:lipocalin-like domain-containing protein [Microvirga sp. ACRRW]MCG7394379.1 lipocalin-like domain-containing protein [Microvirga sp. ACRRW]